VPGAWRGAMIGHVLVFLVLSLLHSLVLSYLYHFYADLPAHMHGYKAWQHAGHFMFGDGLILFDGIIYLLLVATANLRRFYFVAQAKDVEASQLGHQLTLARLQSLRMQINPHFLFNTLNAISVLVMKHENQKAVEMIGRLSHLFRQSLSETQVLISLEAELSSARQYLDIEKVRFGERLEYSIVCEPGLPDKQVPSMLLQPLLENSVRHGFAQKIEAGILDIVCESVGEYVRIQVIDNGAGFDTQQKATGIGMENVRQRLASHYGSNHHFSVESQLGKGTCVSIKLPLHDATPLPLKEVSQP
jgi:LytS/YehU family sensor histidine kinase